METERSPSRGEIDNELENKVLSEDEIVEQVDRRRVVRSAEAFVRTAKFYIERINEIKDDPDFKSIRPSILEQTHTLEKNVQELEGLTEKLYNEKDIREIIKDVEWQMDQTSLMSGRLMEIIRSVDPELRKFVGF